ncbi:hypothetical protein PASE110613_13185 [Paenibacillus sediminis]|uniref:Uncharacterized protein n=1 Tax=Paenibacillus sediminis TaxID=664909 RepID=A0ABS4H3L7_9BACL|nr:hypothetical protein [Paenibacillus sediminis]
MEQYITVFIAPPLVVVATIVFLFIYAAKYKNPKDDK